MRRDQAGHRLLQTFWIDCPTIEFDVEMRRDTAQFLLVGATDPVRMLHGGQRERRTLESRVWLPIDGCCGAAYLILHLVAAK